ncbi:MAG: response regulator transcription factor [Solobacterium sp.]|jgi:DNA-binding response OmpR family regulator|nr:response regulator transcription factor [Solobacterium sp.]MCH4222359.1 response regulator transcription factor [Solobacterium sp.]MCH4265100.1 response regulator transcription factor [Solobacterium sp.]
MTYKILVVEDDAVISTQLQKQLKEWGYETGGITDFQNVTEEFQAFMPSLVLLDIKLPFFNGYHWCSEIRKISHVPVIFVSSASDNMNIIMAMNMGGDDFISKPFDMNVLVAKIQAILRRTYDMASASSFLEYKGLTLNTDDYSVSYQSNKADLTKNEYRILKILMENQGRVISRDQLMQRLWDTNEFIDDNTLTVNITRLRKTLESLGLTDFIITRKGSGYQI